MNRHLSKIIGDASDMRVQMWRWYREQPSWRQYAEALVLVVLVVIFIHMLTKPDAQAETAQALRAVTVAPVSELANSDSELPLLGTVTSTSEAIVRSESSGKLNHVYKKLGDYVTAGQIIAEFDNAAERASVLQAEGAYDSAKAARDIARINSGNTVSSLADVRTNALNAIYSAYNTMDDVVRVKTDVYFNDPRFDDAKLLPSIPDAQLEYAVEAERKSIEKMLAGRAERNKSLTVDSDLVSELNVIQNEVSTVKTYIDDLSSAVAKAVPDATYNQTSLDSARAVLSVARAAIASGVSSVSSTRTSLNSAIAAEKVAGKTSGDASGTIASADANVKTALGAYDAALARLENTIIRSPISGTLNSLSIRTGDFITQFAQVAVVSNNGALEVVTYVTEEDAKRIQVGNNVLIDNTVHGVVTRLASAIDPTTKKIEVRVGITDKNVSMVNGQSVRIVITKEKQTITPTSGPITIPIAALKLTPNGAYVFTISATSSLIALPVKEGAILGDQIQILSGLLGTESIVTDARGLKEGMQVSSTVAK